MVLFLNILNEFIGELRKVIKRDCSYNLIKHKKTPNKR